MPKETKAALRQRAAKIIQRLRRAYPDATCTLDYRDPLELLVATVLSAQCTDVRVNQVTPGLFRKYPNARAFAEAGLDELMKAVQPTGFFRNKARAIQSACRDIVDKHGGQAPQTMDELTALRGVGRKTANVVLGNAFGRAVGVVVDTHVGRLSRRLRLTGQADPEKVEQELMALFDQKDWIYLSHALILHGRRVCAAKRPNCGDCTLSDSCPSAFTFPHNRDGRSKQKQG